MNGKCGWCGETLPQQHEGRPREHCNTAHKQAAYRYRRSEPERREARRSYVEQELRCALTTCGSAKSILGDKRLYEAYRLIAEVVTDFHADPWATWPAGYPDTPRYRQRALDYTTEEDGNDGTER